VQSFTFAFPERFDTVVLSSEVVDRRNRGQTPCELLLRINLLEAFGVLVVQEALHVPAKEWEGSLSKEKSAVGLNVRRVSIAHAAEEKAQGIRDTRHCSVFPCRE